MKATFKFITISIVLCCCLMLLLYAFMPKPNGKKNGFYRKVIGKSIIQTDEIDLRYTGYYFAGATKKTLYFGNNNAKLHVLSVDVNLKDSASKFLKLEKPDSGYWGYAHLSVDSPYIYIAEGVTPRFFIAKTDDLNLKRHLQKAYYFNAGINVSPSSFIVRSILNKENDLLKIQSDSPYVISKPVVIEKQHDGVFCTDGMFAMDYKTKSLIYIYYYRNEYIAIDTNLNIIQKGHTIDTNSVAKIQVANIKSKKSSIFSEPALKLIRCASYSQDKLYVSSLLIGDNEARKILSDNEIIDVYSTTKTKYLYSFYLPKQKNETSKQFIVIDRNLYAIYNHYLIKYKIAEDILLQ